MSTQLVSGNSPLSLNPPVLLFTTSGERARVGSTQGPLGRGPGRCLRGNPSLPRRQKLRGCTEMPLILTQLLA